MNKNTDKTIQLKQGLTGLTQAIQLREEVFVLEQGYTDEFDEIDEFAWHVLILKDNLGVGVGRAYIDKDDPTCYHIGRIAVKAAYRKQSIGTLIMNTLENHIKSLNAKTIVLSAQIQALDFYLSLGYQVSSSTYLDQGQPHCDMTKNLV